MVSPENWENLYAKVRGWWLKYGTCRVPPVLASPVFLYTSNVLLNFSGSGKALYLVALADHCEMAVMMFLQQARPSEEVNHFIGPGSEPWIHEFVYKVFLLSCWMEWSVFKEVTSEISLRRPASRLCLPIQRCFGQQN